MDASRRRCRSARSVRKASAGCWVVFWSARTHLPSSLRSVAAAAAAATSSSGRPASCARSDTTTADAFVSARSLSTKLAVSFDSSWFSFVRAALSVAERRAPRAHEVAVIALDQALRLGVEPERVAAVVERPHAVPEPRVQVDRVLVRGQLRRELGLRLLQRVVGVRLLDVREDLVGAGQQLARALHRLDGVREGRQARARPAIASISASCAFIPSSIAGP
jgi:hypothetical protein